MLESLTPIEDTKSYKVWWKKQEISEFLFICFEYWP